MEAVMKVQGQIPVPCVFILLGLLWLTLWCSVTTYLWTGVWREARKEVHVPWVSKFLIAHSLFLVVWKSRWPKIEYALRLKSSLFLPLSLSLSLSLSLFLSLSFSLFLSLSLSCSYSLSLAFLFLHSLTSPPLSPLLSPFLSLPSCPGLQCGE